MLAHRSPYSVDWQSPINWADSLNRGLRARWIVAPHLSGGTRWHELVSGYHGTLTSMDPPNDWVTSGSTLNAVKRDLWGRLDFDGSNDYVTCGTATQLNLTRFTIAAWLRSAGSSGEPSIVGKGSYGSNGYHLVHSAGGGNVNGVYLHVQGNFCLSTSTLNDSRWHHVVGTYDGATMRIYWDGKLENSTSVATTPNASGTSFEMGRRPGASPYYSGSVAEVMVWDRALTAGEVAGLYADQLDYSRRTLRRWSRRFFALGAGGVTGSPWYYYAQQAVTA